MKSEMQVHLQKIRFFGFHGLDKGEDVIGGEFEITLTAFYEPAQIPVNNIEETVDYTALLLIVRKRMQKPAFLLETLATEIATEVFSQFLMVTEIVISVIKLHPPIENFEGSVGVTFKIKRD